MSKTTLTTVAATATVSPCPRLYPLIKHEDPCRETVMISYILVWEVGKVSLDLFSLTSITINPNW